ncbi:MAG: DUF3857 domain-containing protein [Winogradskyella sp.]|uniref:DUF3857 domain-containing protein n=1 Tax=Winogradskyella sp. TaxID=1883156 RepID=UPI0017B5A749|nr:DUF3857 domain-containing protein [Winogradskyella sp.]
MKKLFIISAFVLGLFNLSAQDYDFGDVSKSELQEKYHPTDSSANAAILYRNVDISFNYSENLGFVQQREVHVRLKIYNKNGFDWANEKVYLYKGNANIRENIKGIKGFTYNLEGNKIKKDKLKGNAVFEEEASEMYTVNSFVLPNVKEGSVIEYTYTVTSTSPFIDDLELQFNIPVNKLVVNVATPQFYRYNRFLNPKAKFLPKINERSNDKRITSTTRNVAKLGSGRGGGFLSSSYDMNDTDYKEIILFLDEENIPALKSESFSGNLDNYKAKLSLELSAILDNRNIVRKSFTSTWDKVSKAIFDNENFGGQLNKRSFFKEDLESLSSGVEDDFQKAFLVENFVKSKVKWNGMYGKYAQKGIRSAYKEGEGNVADVNLLVVAMLRSLGVNANPVLVSTRNNGIPLFPTRDGFNYVICSVESDGDYALIDATEPFSTNNVLPLRVLNWKGRVFKENGSSNWVNLKPNSKSSESTMLNVTLNNDFTATGKVRQNITTYSALKYRQKYTGVSKEDHIKALEADKGDLVISELKYENDKDITQSVRVSYDYKMSDAIDEIGENMYFNPMLFMEAKENPFKLDERKYPIDFIVPFKENYLVNIALPEGYTVASLPEPLAIEFKGGESKFVYFAKVNGKYLQLKVELEVNNSLIQPVDYKDFKAFFEKTVEKQAEQIVLVKA